MEEHDQTEAQPTTEQPRGAPKVLRDVAALTATVDQHSAEIDAISVEQMILVFALGALAGVVFLQHREMRGLARALAE